MKLFVLEYFCSGLYDQHRELHKGQGPDLLHDGWVMLDALIRDLVAAGHQVVTSVTKRAETPWSNVEVRRWNDRNPVTQLGSLAFDCDGILLIGPESDRILLDLVQAAEQSGIPVFSPGSEFVSLASDKFELADLWRRRQIPTPETFLLESAGDSESDEISKPRIIKPRYGAGSCEVHQVGSGRPATLPPSIEWIEQTYCLGEAYSIVVLCGVYPVYLPLCRQELSDDGSFRYLGGSGPVDTALLNRATSMVESALAAMPETVGFVGFDLILGENSQGSADYLIECNPRLTCSYLGIRQMLRENLAQLILDVANGEQVDVSVNPETIKWTV